VNAVTNLRVPYAGKLSSGFTAIGLSSSAQLHRVIYAISWTFFFLSYKGRFLELSLVQISGDLLSIYLQIQYDISITNNHCQKHRSFENKLCHLGRTYTLLCT
jgi:hypothetical protein